MADLLDLRARAAINEFLADPSTQRWVGAHVGGCWDASLHFAKLLERRGATYRFLRFPLPPPLQLVAGAVQHVVAVRSIGGDEIVVDWTAANWLPGCNDRPRLVPLADVLRDWGPPTPICPTCGSDGDVVAVAGGGLARKPLSEHACRGAHKATGDLETELTKALAGFGSDVDRRGFLESILANFRRMIDDLPDARHRAEMRDRLVDLEAMAEIVLPTKVAGAGT